MSPLHTSPSSVTVAPTPTAETFLTAAFYKFVTLPDYTERKAPLLAFCEAHQVKGLILLAHEGINSTIAGAPADVHAVLAYLRHDPLLADLKHKESYASKAPFYRMKVRLKKEIVTLGVPGISPALMAGTYVKPQDWNALISDPDVVVVDTRNDYEVEIGTFTGAINPQIQSFSQLPDWVSQAKALQEKNGRKPKVAMFCTGGIRCEKSTALLRAQGFDEVYHLEGGILKYLETVAPEDSVWEGECFVFDERVSVGHGLVPGSHALCRCCRDPLPAGAYDSLLYEAGVSCPSCHDTTTESQKDSARERQRQWEKAKSSDQAHIGALHIGAPHKTPRKPVLLPPGAPVLYSFRRCPYAMRARLALQAAGVQCELREVALKQKPESLLQASPKGTVPVLVLPERVIEHSLDIMLWALQGHDPLGWLPADPALQTDALQLVAQCDRDFKFNLDRYKYPNRYDLPEGQSHRAQGAFFLVQLNTRLHKHAFLIDHQWRWADAAVAPFVRQFAHADAEWFAAQPWPALQAWLTHFEASAAYDGVMEKYKPWHVGQPQVAFPTVI
ncbi:rhodanese-related sulfurtransferase [Limnohabitans sp. Rim8]|uniref:oxygen-dependent tRNA uridine(34) hydroxylase TrhO n=1 Tax=Limnohabitans sp. Rim8 TaxID=1100718 RepID=UPI0033058A7F